ncbi:MAG: protein kinase domain-containing protein [Egibacteraceae bacterium]
MRELVGRRLGHYELRRVVGRGGMATVYEGYQPSLGRVVAVKVLDEPGDPQFAARFVREARLIGQLEHRNIVAVYDFGEQDGVAYLVLQYVPGGRTLADLASRPLPVVQALGLIDGVLAGLGYAHARGLVHRDVKPSNVLLPEPGWPLLADFGIAKLLGGGAAKLTTIGGVLGTAAYMAPEQALGRQVDARADLYAAGVVCYELLTGRVPFEADTPAAVLMQHVAAPVPPPRQLNPQIPAGVEAALLRALAKDPADRYQNAEQMRTALEAAAAGVPFAEPNPQRPPIWADALRETVPPPERRRRSRLGWLGAGVVIAVLLLALIPASRGTRVGARPGDLTPEPTPVSPATAASPAVAPPGPVPPELPTPPASAPASAQQPPQPSQSQPSAKPTNPPSATPDPPKTPPGGAGQGQGQGQGHQSGWAPVASMQTARHWIGAAAGADGRIYVPGGFQDGRGDLDSVEVYAPSTGRWTTAAPLPAARSYLAVAASRDGRIYAIGGYKSGQALSAVAVYDPTAGSWSAAAPMPTARFGLVAATGPDGRIYAIGGRDTSTIFDRVEVYDPDTDRWTAGASMPTARYGLAAATGIDDRVYAFGGYTSSGPAAATEAYTPGADAWTSAAPMPSARGTIAAAAGPDGRIYVIGGFSNLQTVEAYSPRAGTWTSAAPMPTGRDALAAVTGSDGRVYVIGGANHGSLSTVEAYTP